MGCDYCLRVVLDGLRGPEARRNVLEKGVLEGRTQAPIEDQNRLSARAAGDTDHDDDCGVLPTCEG